MKYHTSILFLWLSSITAAQGQVMHVLFLGNSYTSVNNLPQLVADVAASAGDTLIFDSYTVGGYTLNQHFADSNAVNKIKAGGWDYVVLQDQSQVPALPDYDAAGGILLSELTRQYNPCARPLFYMTWGRKNGDALNCASWPPVCTYEGMDSLLHSSYVELAITTHSEVSPVGATWKFIRENYPAVELYQPDESHPSAEGSYAAACSFYASIFKKDPALVTYNYIADTASAAMIRDAAHHVVYDSLPSWFFADALPVADFHYTIGTGANEVHFINNSLYADNYSWNFGDGFTSPGINPVHTYLSDGSYTVSLASSSCDLSVVHQAIYQLNISFCPFSPVVSPDSVLLCPDTDDTLWTQQYDSYQWFDASGDVIPDDTNQYLVPANGGLYSVLTTINGCAEMSRQAAVFDYQPFQSYFVNVTGNIIPPDTACEGDTLLFVLTPNRPPIPVDKNIQWFSNGLLISAPGNDTLPVTSSGNYQVSYYDSALCPGHLIYMSPLLPFTFIHCTPGIAEINDTHRFFV
jgi:hypothetical protein